jgi:brefeldin A-resistance guanine nucleotide exchange factor 1
MSSVLTYFSVKAAVARGVKAISMIYSLTTRIPVLMEQSHLESKEAWAAYWSPIFRALTTQCTNPCREIRHQSFSSLQRSLLSPELTSGEHEDWTAIFGEVLFPLVVRLLKPEVYSSDPVGMSETRVQAATLLCRIFLHYLVLLSQWEGMLDLWLNIMDRLMNSGQGDSLVSLSFPTPNIHSILIATIIGRSRSRKPEKHPTCHVK